MISLLLWWIALTIVFVLAIASGEPLDVVIGAILAAGTLAMLRGLLWPAGAASRTLTTGEALRRLAAAPIYCAVVVWEITVGTWQVARVVLGLAPIHEPGIVVIPVDDRSEAAAVLTALAATVSPGELVVHHDTERRELHMHLLDASDPDAVRERYRRTYERFQKRVLP